MRRELWGDVGTNEINFLFPLDCKCRPCLLDPGGVTAPRPGVMGSLLRIPPPFPGQMRLPRQGRRLRRGRRLCRREAAAGGSLAGEAEA